MGQHHNPWGVLLGVMLGVMAVVVLLAFISVHHR